MIEDTQLIQLDVAPLNTERVIWAEAGEVAYDLVYGNLYICEDVKAEEEKFAALKPAQNTLGFEKNCVVDDEPFALTTFLADKSKNAEYIDGDHRPGEVKFQELCRFKQGEKVLCVIYDGFYVVIPAIVVRPIDEEYLRQMWNPEEDWSNFYDSVDDFIEQWSDWEWDSVIVRPLVRVAHHSFEPMGETYRVHRVYMFPYKKFEFDV